MHVFWFVFVNHNTKALTHREDEQLARSLQSTRENIYKQLHIFISLVDFLGASLSVQLLSSEIDK